MITNQIMLDALSVSQKVKTEEKISFPEKSDSVVVAEENFKTLVKNSSSDADKLLKTVVFSNIEAASVMVNDLKNINFILQKMGEISYYEMQHDSRKKIEVFESPNTGH